jgi:hypothetical protein
MLFRDDQLGFASADTGYFFLFKQGNLQNQDFNLAERIANRTVDINIEGVNNTDRWLFQLDDVGTVAREWQYVQNIYTAAAQQNQQLRPVYSVTSRANDQITMVFGDGVFSEIPVGTFRAYVRASNGLQYIINPEEMQNVILPISYISRNGNLETITFTCGITRPVSNSQTRESLDAIKQRAPARYYTQDRMVNGEDYNLFPFTQFNSIIKSKAVNRASIGTSRYLDLVDNTGKYSSTNTFGSDGGLWQDNITPTILFSWSNRNEITDLISNQIGPTLAETTVQQFYYANFPRLPINTLDFVCQGTSSGVIGGSVTTLSQDFAQYARVGDRVVFTGTVAGGILADVTYYIRSLTTVVTPGVSGDIYTSNFTISMAPNGEAMALSTTSAVMPTTLLLNTYNTTWNQSTTLANETTGYFKDSQGTPVSVGSTVTTVFRYVEVSALLKFISPPGYYFDNNNRLQVGTATRPGDKTILWASPQRIQGDGSNSGLGNLDTGVGPVTLNNFVPTGAILDQIIPVFVTDLPLAIQNAMAQQIELFRNFGIGYASTDITTPQNTVIPAGSWYLITSTNLDQNGAWSQQFAGDTSGLAKDSSWLAKFVVQNQNYTISFRGLAYYFGSVLQTRFFFYDAGQIYDSRTGTVIRDFVNVLAVNTQPDSTANLPSDIFLTITGQPVESDGYVDDFQVLVSYRDSDNDGVPDDPDFFNEIVAPGVNANQKLVFFQQTVDFDQLQRYLLVEPGRVISLYATLDDIELVKTEWSAGQVFYAYEQDQFYQLNRTVSGSLVLDQQSDWIARTGRQALYFQYRHNSPLTSRIDPGTTNIIDLYVVTQEYYTSYQNWLRDTTCTVIEPEEPTINDLSTAYQELQDYKMISDNVVINSVAFKPLFGAKAQPALRATIKVIRAQNSVASVTEIKSAVLGEINSYFSIDKWNFGDTFYFQHICIGL